MLENLTTIWSKRVILNSLVVTNFDIKFSGHSLQTFIIILKLGNNIQKKSNDYYDPISIMNAPLLHRVVRSSFFNKSFLLIIGRYPPSAPPQLPPLNKRRREHEIFFFVCKSFFPRNKLSVKYVINAIFKAFSYPSQDFFYRK